MSVSNRGDEESLGSGTLKLRDSEEQQLGGSQRTIVASNNSMLSTPTRRSSVSSTSTATPASVTPSHAEVKYNRPVK